MQKLANSYYKCLFILLKLRFDSGSSEEINTILSKYKLISFHQRILFKLASFSFKSKYNSNSPLVLKECLNEDKTSNDIRARSKNCLLIKPDKCSSKYGDRTFKKFYSAYYNKIKLNRDLFKINDFLKFKTFFFENFETIFLNFIKIFNFFDFFINFSFLYN